jgi:hypothetical protein
MTVRLTGSVWNPLGRQTEDRMRAHNIWCVHTMAGSFAGTDAMFHQGGYDGTESHQGVRADGYAEQWQDLAYTADANLDGNPEVISTETEDYGGVFGHWDLADPSQIPAWTAAQCATLIATGVQLCLPGTDPRSAHRDCPHDWACYRTGIPAVLIPDTKPGRRGIGYHAQGVPGVGLVAGGVQWSKSRGKQCPGARRIAQLKTVVIPGIQAALSNTPQGDDMPTVQEIVDAVLAAPVQVGNDRWSLGDAVGRAASTARRIELQVKASDNPDEIAAAVAKALPQGVAEPTTEQLTAAFVAALKQLTQEAS